MKNQSSKKRLRQKKGILKKYWVLYCFIGIFAVISLVFGIYPMFSSIYYSLFKTSTILTTPEFVGLDNYISLFKDSYFWDSFRVTVLFTVISVPLNLVVALALAQLLSFKGIKSFPSLLFKLAIFIPFITPDVVGAVVWKQFFNTNGAMNSLLEVMGLEPKGWLVTPGLAIGVLAFVELWKHVGLYTIIILTNYQLIDRTMYEAAEVDGANGFQKYFYLTIPALKPAIMLTLAYATIQFLKTYTVSRIITFGGPNYATNFMSYYAYEKYAKMDFGKATAIATFLFLLIIGLSFIGSKARRWLSED